MLVVSDFTLPSSDKRTRQPAEAYKIYYIFALLLTCGFTASGKTTSKMWNSDQSPLQQEFARKSAQFAANLTHFLYNKEPDTNIIYSPFSIQTCVGMARIGATGETAAEMDRGLGLPSNDVAVIADSFHSVLANYENSAILKIANKIYVMQGIDIQKDFNEIVSKKFFSSAQSIDFSASAAAAHTINSWVEAKTNNLITNLISPNDVDSRTRIVLVNAIHFKGQWHHAFPQSATREDNFYINAMDSVRVPMMNLKNRFGYAVLPKLDATALEMRYKDSDLAMLVILPNSRNGLANLQKELKDYDLTQITQQLKSTEVIVKFPKFKARYDIELNEALTKLGMGRMFSGHAEFDKMLVSEEPLQVSKVLHKAFIEVNEEGTEAAAATGAIVRKKRSVMPLTETTEFHADHPFVYSVNQKNDNDGITITTLFVGTVKRLDPVTASIVRDEL